MVSGQDLLVRMCVCVSLFIIFIYIYMEKAGKNILNILSSYFLHRQSKLTCNNLGKWTTRSLLGSLAFGIFVFA